MSATVSSGRDAESIHCTIQQRTTVILRLTVRSCFKEDTHSLAMLQYLRVRLLGFALKLWSVVSFALFPYDTLLKRSVEAETEHYSTTMPQRSVSVMEMILSFIYHYMF